METLLAGRSSGLARTSTRRPRRAAPMVALALAALALSACATSSDAPATTDASPPPASSTPEPEPGTEPASRYDLTCDELVPPATISDMFDVELTPTDPLVTAAAAGISVPRMTSILSIGGLACGWTNGEAYNSQYGTNPAYTGVLVTVVPPQASGWSPRAVDAGEPRPGGSCDPALCEFTRVASDAWIELEAWAGPATLLPAGVEAAADGAGAAVDGASPPGDAPVVESAIPADCEELVPTATLEQITGRDDLAPQTEAGGWSEWAEARWIAGDLGCRWMPEGVEEIVVGVDWVRGGVWAFDRIEAGGALVPAPTEIAVSGADRALLRCDPTYGTCGVDLLVGADWLQVTAPEEEWAVGAAEAIASGLAG